MPAEEQAEGSNDEKLRRAVAKRIRAMQIEQQKRELIRKFMDSGAYERLMNVRLANQELYSQLVDLIIQMARSGRTDGTITEEQLKAILAKLTYKPESKIEFRRK